MKYYVRWHGNAPGEFVIEADNPVDAVVRFWAQRYNQLQPLLESDCMHLLDTQKLGIWREYEVHTGNSQEVYVVTVNQVLNALPREMFGLFAAIMVTIYDPNECRTMCDE